MTAEAKLTPMLTDDRAASLARITARRAALDTSWREEIRAAVAEGGSLREVAEVAGISHMAVKFIAHGRPARNP